MATTHDPTAQKGSAQASGLAPQEKVKGVLAIVNKVGTSMLTTRSPDGSLASRAMHPATHEGLIFSYYFNAESGKTEDIERDPQVNVSYYDTQTTDWVSISGTAKINTDRSKVKKHWSSGLKAWFDDKKDGKHTGDENDPRVSMLDVIPTEIRYWKADGKLAYLASVAKSALSSEPGSPGKLIVVTQDEIKLNSHSI